MVTVYLRTNTTSQDSDASWSLTKNQPKREAMSKLVFRLVIKPTVKESPSGTVERARRINRKAARLPSAKLVNNLIIPNEITL
jgi:hypothetical protein